LTPKELGRLMTVVANPRQFKVSDWFLNRKKDYKDGRASQVVTNTLDTKLKDDHKRLKIRADLTSAPSNQSDRIHPYDHNTDRQQKRGRLQGLCSTRTSHPTVGGPTPRHPTSQSEVRPTDLRPRSRRIGLPPGCSSPAGGPRPGYISPAGACVLGYGSLARARAPGYGFPATTEDRPRGIVVTSDPAVGGPIDRPLTIAIERRTASTGRSPGCRSPARTRVPKYGAPASQSTALLL
ncbi:hypothetical protein BAE44_0016771, partial [Dichanthelium oligosanthes]